MYLPWAGTKRNLIPSLAVGDEFRVVKAKGRRCYVKHHDCKRRIGRGRCLRPRYWISRFWEKHTVQARNGVFELIACRQWGVTVWGMIRDGVCHPVFPGVATYKELGLMKRRTQVSDDKGVLHLAAVESSILSKLHPLVAHCSHTQYEDKSPRKPGWWTVKTMGSAWVVEVKDPDSCSRLVVVQQTLDDALTLASVLLESEEAPWEPDPWLKAAESKTKRK